MDERPDTHWAELAQRGDRAAFGELVRRHQDRIYRHLVRLTGSREEALELAQETFIRAWQALPGWRPQAQLRTWLFRIASNAAMDLLRRRKLVEFRELDAQFDAVSGEAGPEARLESRQSIAELEKALARIPPDQREAVLLREVEGLSYAEIGAVTGANEGTVKSRLARARGALAAAYGKAKI